MPLSDSAYHNAKPKVQADEFRSVTIAETYPPIVFVNHVDVFGSPTYPQNMWITLWTRYLPGQQSPAASGFSLN